MPYYFTFVWWHTFLSYTNRRTAFFNPPEFVHPRWENHAECDFDVYRSPAGCSISPILPSLLHLTCLEDVSKTPLRIFAAQIMYHLFPQTLAEPAFEE